MVALFDHLPSVYLVVADFVVICNLISCDTGLFLVFKKQILSHGTKITLKRITVTNSTQVHPSC